MKATLRPSGEKSGSCSGIMDEENLTGSPTGLLSSPIRTLQMLVSGIDAAYANRLPRMLVDGLETIASGNMMRRGCRPATGSIL
jgi:hypothetical protein